MTPVTCDTLELAMAGGNAEEMAAARSHALVCARCAETVAAWDEISAAAQSLRREWPSPTLWPRIEQSMRQTESERTSDGKHAAALWLRLAAAAALVIAVAGGGWLYVRQPSSTGASAEQLLSASALREIERTEAQYASAIERLSVVATSTTDADPSPLVQIHKEKLALIDASIAELREAIAANQFNTRLRQELLAMYREKRSTLEEMLNEHRPGT